MKAESSGISVLSEAIRQKDEESVRLRPENAALVSAKIVGPKDLMARIEVLDKWSGLWKKLAQFRGWPASKHEQNRRENERLRAALQALLNAVTFGPKSNLTPGNPGYRARVPIGFVDEAVKALWGENHEGESP